MSSGRAQSGGGAAAASPNCLKVFIQRDYSSGTMVKFQTRFPAELGDRVRIFHLLLKLLQNFSLITLQTSKLIQTN